MPTASDLLAQLRYNMAWRFVRQPNGLLARFSDPVDDFTHYDMDEKAAFNFAFEHMGREEAQKKVAAGLEDHKPWSVGVKGSGLDRWNEALQTIENIHGKEARERVEKEIGGADRKP